MQTTPNLGMVIPSSDADAFDEMVFVNALLKVDVFAAAFGGKELCYAEISSFVSIPNGGAWTDVLALPSTVFDGSPIQLEFFAPLIESAQAAGGGMLLRFVDSATGARGQIYSEGAGPGTGGNAGFGNNTVKSPRITPGAGAHVYKVQASTINGAGLVGGGGGYESAWMRAVRE